jgi:hypothetical protein
MARPTPRYRFRSPLPSLLVVATAGDQAYAEVLDPAGAAEAPVSGTYRLLDEAGTEKASGAVTTSGTDVVSPSVATSALDPGEGYVEQWSVTMTDGAVVTTERPAIVCRYGLACPIGPSDVLRMSPQLDPTDPRSLSGSLDIDEYIDEAWVQIQSRLIEAGRRPWLSISAHALRTSALHLTHALIYDRISTMHNQLGEHAMRHREQFREAWARVKLTYQTPDGDAVAGKRGARSAALWLGSGA